MKPAWQRAPHDVRDIKVNLFVIERALTYALGCSLGLGLMPKRNTGNEYNQLDVDAIDTLMELRKELGIKTATSPGIEVPAIKQ